MEASRQIRERSQRLKRCEHYHHSPLRALPDLAEGKFEHSFERWCAHNYPELTVPVAVRIWIASRSESGENRGQIVDAGNRCSRIVHSSGECFQRNIYDLTYTKSHILINCSIPAQRERPSDGVASLPCGRSVP